MRNKMYKSSFSGEYLKEEDGMFWIGLGLGFVIGGNFGVILMALFKSYRN